MIRRNQWRASHLDLVYSKRLSFVRASQLEARYHVEDLGKDGSDHKGERSGRAYVSKLDIELFPVMIHPSSC